MPRFHFHLRTPDGLEPDLDGLDLPDLDAAYLEAYRAIPSLSADLMSDGSNPLVHAFVIADARGREVMEVPFTERLRDRRQLEQSDPVRAGSVPADRIVRVLHAMEEMRVQVGTMTHEGEAVRAVVARTRALLHANDV